MDKITEALDRIDSILEKGVRVPFSKNLLVDAEAVAEIIDNLRLNMPRIFEEADNVIGEKNRIINDAKREAEEIISRAETQRKHILDETDIMKSAQILAMDTMRDAQKKADDHLTEANVYIANRMFHLEDSLVRSLNELNALKARLEAEDKKVAQIAQQRAAAKAAAQQKAAQQRAAAQAQAQAPAQQGQQPAPQKK